MSGVEGVGSFRPQTHTDFRRPVPGGEFAERLDGISGAKPGDLRLEQPVDGRVVKGFSPDHQGVDIETPVGTPVKASLAGVVESAGWAGDRGNLLVVRSGDQRIYYGHLSGFEQTPGQAVESGDVLGLSGATGATRGPTLHFEVRVAGQAIDPVTALS